MTKSNGRPANVTSKRYKANRVDIGEVRKSPYVGRSGTAVERRPVLAGERLPDDKIERCLGAVELALKRANREEAIAAIRRAFHVEARKPVTGLSHLEELALRDGFIDLLNRHNIYTINDLLLLEIATLRKLSNKHEDEADSLVLVVERLGFRFSDSDIDD